MVNRGFGHLGIGCYFEKYGNILWSQAVLGGGKLRLKNKLNNYFFSANVMRRPGSAPTFSSVCPTSSENIYTVPPVLKIGFLIPGILGFLALRGKSRVRFPTSLEMNIIILGQ